jgi:hypothetical protein
MLKKIRQWFSNRGAKTDPVTPPVGWTSLSGLLDDLDDVAREHQEIFDTDVRERMWSYLHSRFILHDQNADLPEEFGMFSSEGNSKIKRAFDRNTKNLDAIIKVFDLNTMEKRSTTFTNPKLISENGSHLENYFGAP